MTSPLTPEERADIGSALDAAFAFLPPIAHTRDFLAAFEAARDMGRLLDAERDSLERRALQAERERDEARAALSKSEYWLRTVRETREEEQAERRAQREREAAALARAREFDACSERHLSARQAAEARLEQAREALADRLADAAIRETDRALREAHEAGRTGVPLTGSDRTWDTCFRATFEPILRAALEPGAGS